MKQTDKILRAVRLLHAQGKQVTLWLAGYNVSSYAHHFDLQNVRLIDNPKYEDLLSLMSSVDLAVQLRKFSLGEGSGCISELIALNKNFIAADNLFESHFKQAGVAVSANCSDEELAATIWAELENKTVRNNQKILQTYTFENTANRFMEAVQNCTEK